MEFREGAGRLSLDFIRTLRHRGLSGEVEELPDARALAAWTNQFAPGPLTPTSGEGRPTARDVSGGVLAARDASGGEPVERHLGEGRPAVRDVGEGETAVRDGGTGRPAVQVGGAGEPAVRGVGQSEPAVRDGGTGKPVERDGGAGEPAVRSVGQSEPAVRDGGAGKPVERDGGAGKPAVRSVGESEPAVRDGGEGQPIERDGGGGRLSARGFGGGRPGLRDGGGKAAGWGAGVRVEEAWELREAVNALVRAARDGRAAGEGERDVVNRAAARPAPAPWLGGDGRLRWAAEDPVAAMLALVARDALELVTSPAIERVRACAGEGCAALFLDGSRPGTRRWCSMDTCGNRAKKQTLRAKATEDS